MDNLTHTLAGAALGEAGLKRRSALAMPTLLIGANLPDIDVVAILFGHSLSFRRGWTHGALALVVLPLLLTAGMMAWDRWIRHRSDRTPAVPVRPKALLLLAYLAVFSHPLLDWLNTYGLRWLMPFDGRWFYGDALFIVDPWIWLVLILGVLAARKRQSARAGVTTVALITTYAVVMVATSALGRKVVHDGVAEKGIVPDVVMVGPTPINPNRRDVIIEAAGVYYTGILVWLPRPVLTVDDKVIVSNRDHPLAVAAAADAEVERFLRWARFPFFIFADLGDRYSVRADDLRYGDGSRPSWAAVHVEVPGRSRQPDDPNLQTALETGRSDDP